MIIHNEPVAFAGKPLREAKKVLIMVHGRGDNAQNFVQLSSEFYANDFAFAAPQAIGNTWYPYSFMMPPEKNEPHLSMSLSAISELTHNLHGLGFKPGQLYFAGFSQGACLTLEYTARNARKYGGIIAFTGGLLGDEINVGKYSGDFAGTSVFIGASDHDPHVPEERVHESARVFTEMAAKVTKKIYPGMGHTINQDEINIANLILNDTL